ncbi:GNAT family N-acetyltransferase [Macellibacteroides fermentans]|uniref:Sterol carrier protein domain-containing protein n=1 Tax=Parabacteroides chartae TaxID=1037355 RepID=A0A1T5DDI0_9BACT|nr:GNAT family N-acetyltransferase [Parabacteroides chartae]SKB69762.1 Sterol carrier protein domain-containing protein [Parabacteroides chartae]
MKDIEQLKSLWKSLFGDTEAFISLFFHEVVREENIRVLEEKGRILSALYMLPYPFRIWNQEVAASYISGAGTLPEAQGRGLMRRLLIDSFKEMEHRQIPLSILIPAEPWLYGFYEKSGYATVFAYNQQVYPPKDRSLLSTTGGTSPSSVGFPPKEQRLEEEGFSYKEEGVRLGEDNLQQPEDSLRYEKDGLQCGEDDLQYSENGLKYGEDAILLEKYSISDLGDSFLQKREDLMDACFSYFDQRLRERNACILHPYANFRTIVHDYAISDGKIWVALNNEHIPVGIIFTVPAGGSSFVAKEVVADSEEEKEVLLRTALNHYHASSGIYRTVVSNASSEEGQTIPFGMARIIDANKILSMWAAVNPERRLIIHLSDQLLTNNNGSYCIESGKCYKTTINEHIHAFEVLTMDIGQLAHFLIYPEQPFMSLMFD